MLVGTISVLAVLAVFPQRYRAVTKVLPPLAAVAEQVNNPEGTAYGAFIVSQASERMLALARSYDVERDVVRRLNIVGRKNGYSTVDQALLKIDDAVDVEVLRGNVIEIQVIGRDPRFALAIVEAQLAALRARLPRQDEHALRILESAHVDPRRQLNSGAGAAAAVLAILTAFFEFYYLSPSGRGVGLRSRHDRVIG